MFQYKSPIGLKAACLLFCIALSAPAEEWKLARDRDGIQVYTRTIDGIAFKQFKGVTTIDAPASSLVAVFEDLEAAAIWVSHCEHMELVERISPSEFYAYASSPAPWPIKDRDAVILNSITHAPDTGIVTIVQKAAPAKVSRKENTIRIERIEGLWILTPRSDGKTDLIYQVLSDPGGNLPAWLINLVSVSIPYDVLNGMRNIAGDEKYQRPKK